MAALNIGGNVKNKKVKYVWMVDEGFPCDIRRYAYTHKEAIDQLRHNKKKKNWSLYRLVKVNKREARRGET